MKIATVTGNFYESVVGLFPEDDVEVLPKNVNKEYDLIVFTGGEDINPQRYGSPKKTYHNDGRDELEFEVFSAIQDGLISTKKVLGICRGLQLINVALGGSLIFDIRTDFGNSHAHVHKISSAYQHPLSFMEKVNSLHHQGIHILGKGKEFSSIMSVHTNDGIPEIVCWDDFILAVQFHPELFPDSKKEKAKFVEVTRDWIRGDVSMKSAKRTSAESTRGSALDLQRALLRDIAPEEEIRVRFEESDEIYDEGEDD